MIEATPEFAFAFIRFLSVVACSWPLHRNATRFQKIVYNIRWCFTCIILIIVIVPIFYSAILNARHVLTFTKSLFGGFNATQVCVKMILFRVYYKKYQDMFEEVEKKIHSATGEEKQLYIFYVKRCGGLYVFLACATYFSVFLYILAPIKVDQPFPAMTEYPFPVDTHPTFEIIYIQHSIAAFTCASIPVFDSQIAMLLWYASAQFELLGNEFQKATDNQKFITCIKKHQYLLGFVDDVILCGRYTFVATVVMSTIGVITSGIHLVANDEMYDKVNFVNLSIAFAIFLYISAWPSEHLSQMCYRVGECLYCSPWIKNSVKLNRSVLIAIQRSQKTPAIQVSGIIPQLSLPYYATYLSRSFSYFTTLRIVLAKMEINE